MYKLIKKKNINYDYLIVNDNQIEKQRHHGSLTQGIYSNLLLAIDNFQFDYFICLSSRNLFYRNIDLIQLEKRFINDKPIGTNNFTVWHWKIIIKTKLAEYYIENNKLLYKSPHEGLCFKYKNCEIIKIFLENNISIKNDIFSFGACVEEFSLQTIAQNENNNNETSFIDIGNGVKTQHKIPNDNINFVYKTLRK